MKYIKIFFGFILGLILSYFVFLTVYFMGNLFIASLLFWFSSFFSDFVINLIFTIPVSLLFIGANYGVLRLFHNEGYKYGVKIGFIFTLLIFFLNFK